MASPWAGRSSAASRGQRHVGIPAWPKGPSEGTFLAGRTGVPKRLRAHLLWHACAQALGHCRKLTNENTRASRSTATAHPPDDCRSAGRSDDPGCCPSGSAAEVHGQPVNERDRRHLGPVPTRARQVAAPDATYAWDFGNGDGDSAQEGAAGEDVEEPYDQAGSYTVTLTVADSTGTASTSQTVTVSSGPPTATFLVDWLYPDELGLMPPPAARHAGHLPGPEPEQ